MPRRNREFEIEELDWLNNAQARVNAALTRTVIEPVMYPDEDTVFVPAAATQQMVEAAERHMNTLMTATIESVAPVPENALRIESLRQAMQSLVDPAVALYRETYVVGSGGAGSAGGSGGGSAVIGGSVGAGGSAGRNVGYAPGDAIDRSFGFRPQRSLRMANQYTDQEPEDL